MNVQTAATLQSFLASTTVAAYQVLFPTRDAALPYLQNLRVVGTQTVQGNGVGPCVAQHFTAEETVHVWILLQA